MSQLEERALPIPPDLAEQPLNDFTQELVRAWWDGQQVRSIVRPAFSDYQLAGTMLAELAYHFANGYAMQNGLDSKEVLAGLRKRWDEIHDTGVMTELLATRAMDGETAE